MNGEDRIGYKVKGRSRGNSLKVKYVLSVQVQRMKQAGKSVEQEEGIVILSDLFLLWRHQKWSSNERKPYVGRPDVVLWCKSECVLL